MKHRKLKACLLLLLIPVLLLALYIIRDLPFLSTEAEYRLAEKAAMVGPGKILGVSTAVHTTWEGGSFEYEVLTARTERGVILYDGQIIYRKDLGEPAILVAGSYHTSGSLGPSLPLVLFDEYPDAVRAELTLQRTHGFSAGSEGIGSTLYLEATREQEGYFLFLLRRGDGIDLIKLSEFSAGANDYSDPIPATVRLYDKGGDPIAAISLEILSPGIIAHKERGEYAPKNGLG